ncbi:MAG: NfeD family protein [Prevotella sp.]|nr:NfeD family protein [Prevotella sp.]
MEELQNWYLALETSQQVYWGIAIVATLFFLVQTLLTFIGVDAVDGMDMDVDIDEGDTMDTGGALSLFSIRSLINFAVGFGWAGVCLHTAITNPFLLGLVSLLVGVAFGAMYPLLKKKLMRLESNGAYKLTDCIGKEADVYLRIPQAKTGRGKVQVSINGSIHEIDAMTEGEGCSTGERVRIVSVVGNVLNVEKL